MTPQRVTLITEWQGYVSAEAFTVSKAQKSPSLSIYTIMVCIHAHFYRSVFEVVYSTLISFTVIYRTNELVVLFYTRHWAWGNMKPIWMSVNTKKIRTQMSSCVMTTSPSWQAACRAVRGSEGEPAGGALICSLVLWARRSSSLGRSLSVTADSSHTGTPSSGSCAPEAGTRGATKARCSYLARIHDSRSSLEKQKQYKGDTHM